MSGNPISDGGSSGASRPRAQTVSGTRMPRAAARARLNSFGIFGSSKRRSDCHTVNLADPALGVVDHRVMAPALLHRDVEPRADGLLGPRDLRRGHDGVAVAPQERDALE